MLAIEKQKLEATVTNLFDVGELEWFTRNAYNLALKNTTTWDLRCVVRMLISCVNIIGHFPFDRGPLLDLSQKRLFARFIISSALVSLARTNDNNEKQKRDYLALRTHIMSFDTELVEHLPSLDQGSRDELVRKHAVLLTFDFGAAVALRQWDDLGGIVQRASLCQSIETYQCMADCLLRGQAPGQSKFAPQYSTVISDRTALYSTMRKIINEIWALETFDAMKLSKYTRCLFQATLPLDDGLAMNLLGEACSKARELSEVSVFHVGDVW